MITPFPLSWPEGWPRTARPVRSPFATSFERARYGVVKQLDLLGARDIVISTNLPLRKDGFPYATRNAIEDPGVAVYFTLQGEPRCMACDRWDLVHDNLRAIEKSIDAIRGMGRWGTQHIVTSAFTGMQPLPAGNAWYEVLGVEPTATRDMILMAYRRLVKQHHPDAGGDPEQFHRIQQAYDQAVAS